MRKGMLLAIAGLLFLAGCGNPAEKGISIEPKWKGAPYRISFDAPAGKSNPGDVKLPGIKFTANPEALENRALLVMRFAIKGPKDDAPVTHRMIGAPVDIKGAEGALPADYLERASKDLKEYVAAYCGDGKVNVSLALVRSSLHPQASDAELDGKRLSDWQQLELTFKKPRSKC